jgi:N-acetylglucosaminyldiphosphoundecaprenol N-acetyl-beta-D-mannosaminyltransferase
MKLLDEKIFSGTEFLKIFGDANLASSCKIISFVNPYSYDQLKNRNKLINDIDYFFSDGGLLCFFNNLFKKHKITRASFDYSSIAGDVLEFAEINDMKVAIIGATETELELAVNALTFKHKRLNVVFSRNGYFKNNNEMLEVIGLVSSSKADLVIVGMGTPMQEEFSVLIKENTKKTSLILTCGGFLTQSAISLDYYPPLINKLGLRWLQRVVMHKHVRSRIIRDYPRFIYNYIKSNIFNI